MAKIKFGMMMTDARGKLGGQVFSKNRSGAYVRTKVTPVNPRTSIQQANRALLGAISSSWSSLSENSRDAWNAAVDQWQKTDVFGDVQKPTGKNLFTSLNKVMISNFPSNAVQQLPPAKVEFYPFVIDNVVATVSTGDFVAFLDIGESGIDTFQVRATPPVTAGTSYVSNLFRSLDSAFSLSGSNQLSFGAAYSSRFGEPVIGQKIFVEIRQVAENGQLGVPYVFLATIVA